MRNRLIYAAVGVVGLLLVALAIASATVWRADNVLLASATADQGILVTDPGVLEMAGDPVTVTATVSAGDQVVLAVGRDTDVDGWVGATPHQQVSGLTGWHTLALAAPAEAPTAASSSAAVPDGPTTAAADGPATAAADGPTTAADPPSSAATSGASAAPAPSPSVTALAAPGSASATVPDATDSDMWVTTAQGTGKATLTWQAQPGRWSLLVVGTTSSGVAAPPTLSLAWPRTVTTPYLVPGVVVGGLLAVLGGLLFWHDLVRRRGAWTLVVTEAVPVLTGGAPVTRRQMREVAEAARTGQFPVVRPDAVPGVPVASGGVPTAPVSAERVVAASVVSASATSTLDSVDRPAPAGAPDEVSTVFASRRERRLAAAGAPAAAGAGDESTRAVGAWPAVPAMSAGAASPPAPSSASAADSAASARARHRSLSSEPVAPPAASPVPSPAAPVVKQPAWLPTLPSGPAVPASSGVASAPPVPAAARPTPPVSPRPTAAVPAAQASWLDRVAAQWDREDAADEALAASAAGHGAADAVQPDASSADAWRRAWGLTSFDAGTSQENR